MSLTMPYRSPSGAPIGAIPRAAGLSLAAAAGVGLGLTLASRLPPWSPLLALGLAGLALITPTSTGRATDAAPTEQAPPSNPAAIPALAPPDDADPHAPIPLPPPDERPDVSAAIGESDAATDWEARYAAAGRPITTLDATGLADPDVEARVADFLNTHPRGAVILRNARNLPTAAEAALTRLAARPGGPLLVLTLRLGAQAVATLLAAPATKRSRRVAARLVEDGLPALARLLGTCHIAPRRGLAAHAPATRPRTDQAYPPTKNAAAESGEKGAIRQQGTAQQWSPVQTHRW